jgi:uncharacterized protein
MRRAQYGRHAPADGGESMRILVIADDYWHPAKVARAGLDLMQEHVFKYVEDAADWSAEAMGQYPLTVFAKSNNATAENREPWMTPEVEAAFVAYVRAGGGLLAVHSGTAGYADTPTLRALLGGVFEQHPKQCPVTFIPRAGHPLCQGVEQFTLVDEHYHMIVDDPAVDIFATTRSEHGDQPGGWTRSEGEGRVCVVTPGHNVEIWQHPSFQALLRNCLAWCAQQS